MRRKAEARTPSLNDVDLSLKLEPAVYVRKLARLQRTLTQSSRRICFQGDPR